MPEAEYCSIEAINHSTLKCIHPTPLHLQAHVLAEQEEEEAAVLRMGQLIHGSLFRPHFRDSLVVKPATLNMNSKEGRALREETERCGRQLLSVADWEVIIGCSESIRRHPFAKRLLQRGYAEVGVFCPYFFEDGNVPRSSVLRKGRIDWVPPGNTLVDVKSVPYAGADPRSFARAISQFQYHQQAAFYLDLWNACGAVAERLPQFWQPKEIFLFIVVEKEPPFAVATYQLGEESIELGRRQWMADIERYWECRRTGQWPGYPEEPTLIDVPGVERRLREAP